MDDGKEIKEFNCDEQLFEHIRTNLSSFTIHKQNGNGNGNAHAAVAITIVNVCKNPAIYNIPYDNSRNKHAAIVLTRRASGLRNHAGQWALPGGKVDPGETPEDAALRELEEEVGLELGADRVMGRLDDFSTRSGFTISPVVVWGGSNVELTPNFEEVDSIHRIPLMEFMRSDSPVLQNIPESNHPVLFMPIGNGWIATPTGALLYQFREVAILGKEVRVAHYEQPYFAWK